MPIMKETVFAKYFQGSGTVVLMGYGTNLGTIGVDPTPGAASITLNNGYTYSLDHATFRPTPAQQVGTSGYFLFAARILVGKHLINEPHEIERVVEDKLNLPILSLAKIRITITNSPPLTLDYVVESGSAPVFP